MIELSPIRATPADWDDMEALIAEHFRKEIYLPLLDILKLPESILNAPRKLLQIAISKNRIRYEDGMLKGKFSAGISKEIKALGGVWNRKHQAWSIDLRQMPGEIRGALSIQTARVTEVLSRIDSYLGSFNSELLTESPKFTEKMNKLFDAALQKFELKFDDSVKKLTLPYRMPPKRRAKIAEEYTDSLKLPIKKFSREATLALREKVLKHTTQGARWEGLIKDIEHSYHVSVRKAKFLARQETHLMMASYKKSRYTESGITHYKWRCVTGTKEHPVRPMHRKLNDRSLAGELFEFDNPPIDDPNGSRHNPGQNFNCRCVSIPIVKF